MEVRYISLESLDELAALPCRREVVVALKPTTRKRQMPRLVLDDMGRVVDWEQVITDSYVIGIYFHDAATLMVFDLCFDEPSGQTSEDHERLESYLSEDQVQQTLDAINACLA